MQVAMVVVMVVAFAAMASVNLPTVWGGEE
jgi:hypothetical protein